MWYQNEVVKIDTRSSRLNEWFWFGGIRWQHFNIFKSIIFFCPLLFLFHGNHFHLDFNRITTTIKLKTTDSLLFYLMMITHFSFVLTCKSYMFNFSEYFYAFFTSYYSVYIWYIVVQQTRQQIIIINNFFWNGTVFEHL